MNKFLMLLRKDCRINWAPIVLAISSVAPYVYLGPMYLWAIHERRVDDAMISASGNFAALIRGWAFIGIVLSSLIAAPLGACAFATERHERSANFLAILPVSRRLIILSKLTVAFACTFPVWLLHFGVICYLPSDPNSSDSSGSGFCLGCLSISLGMFGIAWMCSTFFDDSPNAGAMPFLVLIGGSFFAYWWVLERGDFPQYILISICCMIGSLTLATGCVYYLRRVAP